MQRSPENLAELRSLLQQAMHPELQAAATQKLTEAEALNGFLSCLITVALEHNLDPNLRLFASIHLKNAIRRRFQKRLRVSEEDNAERDFIKATLLTEATFAEPQNHLAVHLGVCVAQIAVNTWPRAWGDLFPTLLNVVQSENPLHTKRGLYVFHQVLKRLCPNRIRLSLRAFIEMTEAVIEYIRTQWKANVEAMFEAYNQAVASTDEQGRNEALNRLTERAALSLQFCKVLHRLVTSELSLSLSLFLFFSSLCPLRYTFIHMILILIKPQLVLIILSVCMHVVALCVCIR